jgi:hypothetical protein
MGEAPTESSYRAIAYRFRVRSSLADVRLLATELLAPFAAASGAGPAYDLAVDEGDETSPFAVRLDGALLHRLSSPLGMLDELLWHVNRSAIESASAAGFLAIHASAVRYGRAGVVLAAPMDSGKTTLAAGLVREGAEYVTDEAALLEIGTGSLRPYPKTMWLAPPSIRAIEGLADAVLPPFRDLSRMRVYVRPQDLGGRVAEEPGPVTLVIAPRFRPKAPLEVERLSSAGTLMLLAENAFNLREFRAPGIDALRDVAAQAAGYAVTFGDLAEACAAIRDLAG